MTDRVSKERLTVSLDARVAARVRQCAARTRGGASGYVERLIRADELRDALDHAAAYDAAIGDPERDALLDAAEAEIAQLPADEQAAAVRRLGLAG